MKLATGGAGAGSETVTVWVAMFVPPEFETVKVTVKMPLAAYVLGGGPWPAHVVPSPNAQPQARPVPVDVSVKVTASGVRPEAGVNVNDSDGPRNGDRDRRGQELRRCRRGEARVLARRT